MVPFAVSESWLLKTGFQNGNIFFDQDSPIPDGHERKPKEKTEYPPNFSNHCGRRVKKFLPPYWCISCYGNQREVVARWFERRRMPSTMEFVFPVLPTRPPRPRSFEKVAHISSAFGKIFFWHCSFKMIGNFWMYIFFAELIFLSNFIRLFSYR